MKENNKSKDIKMVKNLKALLLLVVIAAMPLMSSAADKSTPSNKATFMVSGMLQLDDVSKGVTMRLVHSIIVAQDIEQAAGQFKASVTKQFKGYTLKDTLVSPVTVTTTLPPIPASSGFTYAT